MTVEIQLDYDYQLPAAAYAPPVVMNLQFVYFFTTLYEVFSFNLNAAKKIAAIGQENWRRC